MPSKKTATIFLIGLFVNVIVNAQTNSQLSLNKVLPPSPTAAGLVKYADVPVSLYTGTPGIQLPIYSVKSGRVSLPISLSYHASGIKVGEQAGNVGLGWSLIAGGVITRTIRDREDDNNYQTNQYFNWDNRTLDANTPADYALLYQLSQQTADAVPDVYSYNFNGNSGKFVYADQLRLLPQAALKIEKPVATNDPWKITTEDGTIYTFGASEDTYNRTTGSATFTSKVAWYLTKIESPQSNDVITLEYDNTEILQDGGWTFSRSYRYGNVAVWDQSNPQTSSSSETHLYGKQLKRIVFKDGTVEFGLGWSRDDSKQVAGVTVANPKVDNIVVKDLSGRVVKYFKLNYSYFQVGSLSGYLNKRLKLISFQESAYVGGVPSADQVLTHSFDYNSQQLPPLNSFAQDHWGYYNGKTTNTHLIPSYSDGLNPITLGPLNSFTGADRSAGNEVQKAGILEKITYPTGGSVQLEFEPHDWDFFPILYNYSSTGSTIATKTTSNSSEVIQTSSSFNIPLLNPGGPPNQVVGTVTASLSGYNGTTLTSLQISHSNSRIEVWLDPGDGDAPSLFRTIDLNNTSLVQESFYLNAGANYYIKAVADIYNSVVSGQLSCDVPSKSPTPELIGGLRIKKKTVYDGVDASHNMVTNYSYRKVSEPTRSSGSITALPVYFSQFWTYVAKPPTWCNYDEYRWITLFSTSKLGIGSGSHVGYSEVTTSFGTNGENGKNVSFFTSFEQSPFVVAYGTESDYDWRRGLVQKEETYDKDNQIKLRVESFYTNDSGRIFLGRQIDNAGIHPCQNITNPAAGINGYAFPHFNQRNYLYLTEWQRLTKTIETVFVPGGANMVTTKEFFYDNFQHKQLSQVKETNSKGQIKKLITKYPQDLVLSGSAETARQSLIIKNILSAPLQQTNELSGSNLDRITTNYFNFSNGYTLPSEIWNQHGSAANEKRIEFLVYDNTGNLQEQAKTTDVKQCYVWGYSNSYPIAEVVNAAVKDVFHTSFEDADGNSADNDSKTGKKSRTGGYSKALAGLTNGSYILSYWQKVASTWNFIFTTVTVSAGTYSLSLTGQVDEVRFYPSSAQMNTYTYEPLVGISSKCDINNRINYYEYDELNRLTLIRDQDRNIQKKICYNYWGQPEDCSGIFSNDVINQSFTRNNCTAGAVGSTVIYTVPAGLYKASSKSAANVLAQNDIIANGQSYANTNGTCLFYNDLTTGSFTRNNCGAGYTGSTVVYSVPASTYSSATSKAAANQLAQNDVNTNGQIYANSNGTCTSTSASCSFSMMSGYSSPSNSISTTSGNVSLYIIFYSSTSMVAGTSYTIANISTSCRPLSGSRTMTYASSGRTWTITVQSNGNMQVQFSGGTTVNSNSTVILGTVSYVQ